MRSVQERGQLSQTWPRFEQAAKIFKGRYVAREDLRHAYGERRWIAIGEYAGDVLAVVFTERGADVRIISARRARKDERKAFEDNK